MKINIVCLDESLISTGARKLAAYVCSLNPDTTVHYIALGRYRSPMAWLFPRHPGTLDARTAHSMADPIADADIVAFSSMSHLAEQTKAIIREVRRINPQTFIMWGGIHPIIVPEDAIEHADAVCTGEGEFAFAEFLDAFRTGSDYTRTRNFWFNRQGRVTRSGFRPLMSSARMDALPFPLYGHGNEMVYRPRKRRYEPLSRSDYMNFVGLTYNTIWTIGCPFRCSFCANTRFIDNDPAYTKLRYPSPRWMVDEINSARRSHPHLSNVVFHDDSFMALPPHVLRRFAELYAAEVDLPFCVMGVIPGYVSAEKMEILLEAGLNRVRMGIQSGSERILDFYERPTSRRKILAATDTLAKYRRYMIPPGYDMIVDNPIETRQDVVDTLELTYRMSRPFSFNFYALRVQPNTQMARQFASLSVSPGDIGKKTYTSLTPSFANCLLMLLLLFRPPRRLFDQLLQRVKPVGETQRMYPLTYLLLRLAFLSKRVLSHVCRLDFTTTPGHTAAVLWRLGLVRLFNRHLRPRFKRPPARLCEPVGGQHLSPTRPQGSASTRHRPTSTIGAARAE